MIGFITVLIAIIGVLLMAVVLIQNPKGGGVDANFGGQAANQLLVHPTQLILLKN